MTLETDPGPPLGPDPRVASALAYLAWWLSGVVVWLIERDRPAVRFHAMQSMLASVAAMILWIAFMVVWTVLVRIPFLGVVAAIVGFLGWAVLALGLLAVWLFCMFKAFQGDRFKLPFIGEVAEKQVWANER